MRKLWASYILRVCILALVTILPFVASADGIVFSEIAYAMPQIPDQRALIQYADGTETLVIETSFVGQGTNFAWVVFLPAVPEIEPVSTGLFPTLQIVFQPKVVLSVKHYWLILPMAAVAIWLKRRVQSEGPFVILVLSYAACLLLAVSNSLNVRTTAASTSSSPVGNVCVLNRQEVGLFDTVTIQSGDPVALMVWLNRNGFATPTNIAPVVADYVREGWVFAAARLRRDDAAVTPQATHPLAFTFKTRKPVYPLRLTAKGTASCRIDLYVFGPGGAAVPGFSVRRSETPTYGPIEGSVRLQPGELRIRNRELAKWVDGSPVATKLSAVLDRAGMARDAYVSWRSSRPAGGAVYSTWSALTMSANGSAFVYMVLAAFRWRQSRLPEPRRFDPRRWGRWVAPVAVTTGIGLYFLVLPKVDGGSLRITRYSSYAPRYSGNVLSYAIQDALWDSNVVSSPLKPMHPLTPVELERVLTAVSYDNTEDWSNKVSRSPSLGHPLTNLFTGEALRFEASPGNVILRPSRGDWFSGYGAANPSTNGYDLVWHDLDGAEAITNFVLAPWR